MTLQHLIIINKIILLLEHFHNFSQKLMSLLYQVHVRYILENIANIFKKTHTKTFTTPSCLSLFHQKQQKLFELVRRVHPD